MQPNYDKTLLVSKRPVYRNYDTDSFTMTISGTVAASGVISWTGTKKFSKSDKLVRISMIQDTVPGGASYLAGEAVPLSMMVGGSVFGVVFPTTGAAASASPNVQIDTTANDITVRFSYSNPFASALTFTSITLRITYTAFRAFSDV